MHSSDRLDTLSQALPLEALESSAFGVFILDPRFNVVWMNRTMESYFGIRREEAIGRSKRAMVNARIKHMFEDPERFAATVLATYDRNTYAEDFQCHVLPGEGRQERWLERRSRPIETGDLSGGRIEHYYDVTEMVRAQQRLRDAAAKWQSTFDAVGEAVCVLDLEGRAQTCNRTMLELTGLTLEQMRGRPCWELMHGSAGRPPECPVNRMLATGRHAELTLQWRGRRFQVSVDPLRDVGGTVTGLVHVMRDVSLQKQAEEARKLESLSVLAGGIAHDFNNLLMGVMGNAEMALADLPEDSPVREEIELAMEAARQAADLSKLMLAYSGKGRFVKEPLDLRLVAIEAIGRDALSVDESERIVIRRQFSDDVPTVSADPGQVTDLLRSLIVNAREAISGRGTITLSVGRTECSEEMLACNRSEQVLRPGRYVYVSVSDTGCGMNAETLDRLFDPFYSTKFVGRGLGLSAALGIVRAHGAGILVESEEGRGANVRILFPTDIPVEPDAHVDETGGGECVLLVDDEKQVRIVSAKILEREGFSVVTASDGLEAVKMLSERGGEIGCVVLDLSMPHLGGEATYHRIRGLGSDVPVILSSGYDESEATQRFEPGELVGFLGKPYSRGRLVEMVRLAMQRRASDA
jgi:PAS domain S-box-containing protein